jgi:type II secretory pathway component PulC
MNKISKSMGLIILLSSFSLASDLNQEVTLNEQAITKQDKSDNEAAERIFKATVKQLELCNKITLCGSIVHIAIAIWQIVSLFKKKKLTDKCDNSLESKKIN